MLFSHITKCPAARILFVWMVVALVGVAGISTLASSSYATAVAASGGVFRETGHLHQISKNGSSFTEQGPASGTFSGTLTLYLTATSRGVTFQMSAKPPGGTLSGHGSANIESEGRTAKVSGTAVFTRGSGRYAHAHGTRLKVTGTYNRETYSLVVTLSGHLSY